MSTTRMLRTAAVLGVYAAMPPEERAALHEWEREHCGAEASTGWPGWDKYLPPEPPAPPRPARAAKTPIPRGLRRQVFERDAYRCRHCGDHHRLCADHVIPEARGGETTLANLQTLCARCNSRKGAR